VEIIAVILLMPVLIYAGVLLVFQTGLQKQEVHRSQDQPGISIVSQPETKKKIYPICWRIWQNRPILPTERK